MTSYQRRKREIRFYKQCVRDLEIIIDGLLKQMKEHDLPLFVPLGNGLEGDEPITPYNCGEYLFRKSIEYQEGRL